MVDKKILDWNSRHGDKTWNLVGKPTKWEDFTFKRNKYYFKLCKNSDWNMEKTSVFAAQENMSNALFRSFAMDYSREGNEIRADIRARRKIAEKYYNELLKEYNGIPFDYKNLQVAVYNSRENNFIAYVNESMGYNVKSFEEFYYEFYLRNGKEFYKNNPEFFSYKLCELFKFCSSNINDFVNKLGLHYYEVRKYAEKYKIKESGMTSEQFVCFYHDEQFNNNFGRHKIPLNYINKYYQLLENLDLEEKKSIVKEIQPNYLTIRTFALNHINPNYEEIIDTLSNVVAEIEKILEKEKIEEKKEIKKINIEIRKKNLEDKKRELLASAQKSVEAYLESDILTLKKYCDVKKIDLNIFRKNVEIVKKFDVELYDKYNKKVVRATKKRYAIIMDKAKRIILNIKNGIEMEDGTKRPFNIIDYYRSTSMNLEEFFNLIKNELSTDDVRAFRNFASKNNIKVWGSKDIGDYYKTTIRLGVKFDDKNNVIVDSGHVLTLEEKKYILNYITNLKIPICRQTVNIIQQDFLDGKIKMEDEPEYEGIVKK